MWRRRGLSKNLPTNYQIAPALPTDDAPSLSGVAIDNFDITESESLLVGTHFGIVTDIETDPDGNLIVVSLDQGTIHEISRR